MPTPTYTPLATVTLGSSASSVTFSSIPATYRDLILVVAGEPTSGGGGIGRVRFNSDTGSNYSIVTAEGTGSAAQSGSLTTTFMPFSFHRSTVLDGFFNPHIIQVMDYSATDKHKSVLLRANASSNGVVMTAGRWANTSAITIVSFTIESGSWDTGSTFNLYGVIA
jgi:hypothetical protein